MKIRLNEKTTAIAEGTTLDMLADSHKPGADILIMNGFPAPGGMRGVTVVAASGLAGYGPNNDIITRRVSSRLYLVGDMLSEAGPGSGLMAPRVGIAASHQVNQVLRIILGADEP